MFDLENEDDNTPESMISNSYPVTPKGANPTMSDLIKQKIMAQMQPDTGDMDLLDKAKEESRSKEQALNLAQAMQPFARGASAPVSSDALYANLAKQAGNATLDAEDEVKRRQAVRERIAQNMMNADKFAYQKQKDIEDRDFKRQMLGLKAAEINATNSNKESEKLSELEVPDYKLGGTIKPQKMEVKDFRDSIRSFYNANQNLDQLKDLVAKSGTEFLPGEAKGDMQAVGTDLQLQIKDLAKLGVLSVSDLEMIKKLIPDPTSISSNLLGFVPGQNESIIHRIDTVKDLMKRKVDTKAKSLGYLAKNETPKSQTKVVDGVTYQKVPGGWEEVQ